MAEEEVCDCVGDGKGGGVEPEEFAGGIEFEKDVAVVGCEDDVDGAVVQGKVVHEAQDLFLNVKRELIGAPFLKHAEAVAAPVVSGASGDL